MRARSRQPVRGRRISVLNAGTVSTNVDLRKLHNFALDMDWLPKAVIPKRQWPEIRYKETKEQSLSKSIVKSSQSSRIVSAGHFMNSAGILEALRATSLF